MSMRMSVAVQGCLPSMREASCLILYHPTLSESYTQAAAYVYIPTLSPTYRTYTAVTISKYAWFNRIR